MLFVAIVAGVIGIAAGQAVVFAWSAAVGAMAAASIAWARTAWNGVTVEARFAPARVFAREDVVVRVRIANAKRIPLPIVRITIRFPPGVLPAPDHPATELRGYRRRLSLPGHTETILHLPAYVSRRGEYWLEGVEVELSDPFDLVPLERTHDVQGALLVLPEPRSGVPLRLVRRLPFGAPAPGQHLFEDREHFAGVRDYEPGDPMRHVHWRLSAHAGGLQTKRFEPARSADVMFAIDVARGEPFWYGVNRSLAEESIGLASYLARQAIHAGWRTGLVANTHYTRGRGPLRVPPSTSVGAEAALFAALARMPNQPTTDLGPLLRETSRGLSHRTTIVVVSPDPGPSLRHEMARLRRRGFDVHEVSPLAEPGAAAS